MSVRLSLLLPEFIKCADVVLDADEKEGKRREREIIVESEEKVVGRVLEVWRREFLVEGWNKDFIRKAGDFS